MGPQNHHPVLPSALPMTSQLSVPEPALLSELDPSARRYLRASKAQSTLGAYRRDVADFEALCAIRDLSAVTLCA